MTIMDHKKKQNIKEILAGDKQITEQALAAGRQALGLFGPLLILTLAL